MRRRNKKTRSRNKKTPWRFAVFGHGKGWFSAEVPNFAHRTNYGICCIHSRHQRLTYSFPMSPCEPKGFTLLSPFHYLFPLSTYFVILVNATIAHNYLVLTGFLNEAIEASLKFFRAFSCCIDVCNTNTLVRRRKIIIVIPYFFVLFNCCNNVFWKNIGSIDYTENMFT